MTRERRRVPESWPASWTVRRARDAYLAENGFTVAGYDAKWTKGDVCGVPVWFPNTERHRWAIMLHDLHHVATGYGTDLVGEGEISVWELRALGALGLYVESIVGGGALMGFALAPRRALAALRASRRARYLYAMDVDYEGLLDKTVGELRAILGVPEQGIAHEPRRLHTLAPA